MNGCEIHRKRLCAHLDGELLPPERAAVEAHLALCAACRALSSELAEADRALMSAPEPAWRADATDALVGRLKTTLAREAPAPVPAPAAILAARGWGAWRSLAFGVAGILALVLVPSMLSLSRAPESREAQVARAPAAAPAKDAAPSPAAAPLRMAQAEAVPAAPPHEKDRADALAGRRANVAGRSGGGAAPARPAEVIALAKPARPAEPAAITSSASRTGGAAPAASAPGAKPPAEAGPGPDPLFADLAKIEARLKAVEAEVAQFTLVAREQAMRASQLASARRYPSWR